MERRSSALRRSGRFDRRTAIVGGGNAAEAMIKALDAQPETGIRIVGLFDDRDEARSPDVVAGYPKMGGVDDLVEYARRTKLDLVVFTLPISAEKRILQMLAKLWVLPIDIRLSAHTSKLRLRPRSYSYIGSVPVLDVFDKPIADWDLVLKGQSRRLGSARPRLPGPPPHRHRREARFARAGVLPAEALRLQQRAHRGV
jgi:FlaA1/EpsC-like NDP-sugar epimerase